MEVEVSNTPPRVLLLLYECNPQAVGWRCFFTAQRERGVPTLPTPATFIHKAQIASECLLSPFIYDYNVTLPNVTLLGAPNLNIGKALHVIL